jgi:uncharacterized protein YndB with AHSA1/START domain
MKTEPTKSQAPVKVTVSRRFKASAERVFDAWLDPARAGKWLFATPTGTMVRVEIDARVGGSYAVVERRDGQDAVHVGEYLEIERPRRLVFTLSDDESTRTGDRVTVEIVPLDGGCEVTLTHEMRPDMAEHAGRAEEGWTGVLEGLAATLG